MTDESTLTVLDGVSFEAALTLVQVLLNRLAQGNLPQPEVQRVITKLVATESGARGFFVTYLSDERPLADVPTPAVIASLKSSPAIVAPLMVKNLAMSTAMAIAHRRNQQEELARGSDRVRTRSIRLIRDLRSPQLIAEMTALLDSLKSNSGTYQTFLDRWRYDDEQKQAMQQALLDTKLIESRH